MEAVNLGSRRRVHDGTTNRNQEIARMKMSSKRLVGLLYLACFAVVMATGCSGADGINGTSGADGTNGADGADGTNGTDFPGPVPAEYTAANGILGGAADHDSRS
jgi:hypothetical protein